MRYNRSPSHSASMRDDDKMDINGGAKGGLKIKGQAEAQKRKSKWEDDGPQDVGIFFIIVNLQMLTII